MPQHPIAPPTPLFGIQGFDPRSSDAQLAEKRKMRLRALQEQANSDPNLSTAERTASNVGSQLASFLGERRRPTQLNEQEQRFQTIKDQGQAAFAEELSAAQESGEELSLDEQNQLLFKTMAEAALEAGDMGTFQQISQQAQELSLNRRLTEAKIAEAEGAAAPPTRQSQVVDIGTKTWSASARTAASDAFAAAKGYNRVVDGVSQAFEDVIEMGEDPSLITQIPGGVTGALQNAISAVRQGPAIAGNVFGMNEDGTLDETSPLSLDALVEKFHIAVPDIINGARERGIYKSLMVQLAYQQWRQQEGSGARQASDQDIERALTAVGANQSDARIVASVLAQNHANSAAQLADKLQQETIRGASVGLQGQEVSEFLFGARAEDWEEYQTSYQSSQGRLGRIAQAPVPDVAPEGDDVLDYFLTE